MDNNDYERMEISMKVFCIPAGGTNPFYTWNSGLSQEKKLYVLDLPGRGTRLSEPFITDFTELIKNMTDLMEKDNPENEPYVIFGYCFGAIIGYEMCKLLKRENKSLPEYLIQFGSAAPNCRSLVERQDKTDSEEFKRMVAQFLSPTAVGSEEKAKEAQQAYISEYKKSMRNHSDITVESIFPDLSEEDEFEMQMMLNLLNNSMNQIEQDQTMLSDYFLYSNEAVTLDVKAKVIYALEDSFVSKEDVLLWQQFFRNVEMIYVSGDHYAIMNYPQVFVDIINQL